MGGGTVCRDVQVCSGERLMTNMPGVDTHRTASPRVLVADDNPLIRDVVRIHLERDALAVVEASDGNTAMEVLNGCPDAAEGDRDLIDLAVIDVCIPGRNGIDVCRAIRAGSHRPDLPIILISGLGVQDRHRVIGLEAGADDYVAKPFSPRELALRVGAVLRRSRPPAGAVGAELCAGGIRVSPDTRAVLVDGVRVHLTAREYQLLEFLLRYPYRVFSRGELLARVWGWEYGDLSTVTVHVKRLRAKLGAHHRISTVWGRGYSWGRDEAIDVAAQ
ncbi:DNA-binding response OmpR family regulator [Nocardia transvalensis]|uniref:DNA-binding response OmpR family regulator n=2 Tax=Nocardia transvalensis TaxID=37333 RepID=A0A7W9PHX8_9NOCA|nr:DNA-binding response OmpR family regulator [Nocardia transvalensis]